MKKQIKEETKEVNKSAMDEMSGDAETRPAPKYVLPSLKVNGKVGTFYRTVIEDEALKLNEDGKAYLEDLGKSVKGVILKVRKTYFYDGADMQMYSNEVGAGKNEKVSIFCKTENVKGGFNVNHVFSGTPAQVKERYPEISMIQVIYFLLDETGEIVRLKVKGMSLPQLFDYFKGFENHERKYEYITELGVKPDQNKFGSFFVNTFKRGKKVEDLVQVEVAMKEVFDKITEIEEYYKDYNEPVEQEEIPFEKKGDEKAITNEDIEEEEEYDTSVFEKDKEIDVNKIPY